MPYHIERTPNMNHVELSLRLENAFRLFSASFEGRRNAFSELYKTVEKEDERREDTAFVSEEKKKPVFSLQRLLSIVDIDKIGLLPIVLLLLLLVDVDDDEKLIIIALAVIFGI